MSACISSALKRFSSAADDAGWCSPGSALRKSHSVTWISPSCLSELVNLDSRFGMQFSGFAAFR